jgi:hypothetical protein
MKMKHTFAVGYLSGKMDQSVYYPAPGENFSVVRKLVYPTLTANNHNKGAIMKNLRLLWLDCDPGYVADGVLYASRYYSENKSLPNLQIPVNNSFGNFVRMLWAWYKEDPLHIDLLTVTVADIVTMDADIRTWSRAIGAGYLPGIDLFSDLDNDISGT